MTVTSEWPSAIDFSEAPWLCFAEGEAQPSGGATGPSASSTVPPQNTAPATPAEEPADTSLLGEPTEPAQAEPEPAAFDPEKITVPEGVVLDKDLFGKFGEIAVAQKLSQEGAQQLIDLCAGFLQQEAAKIAESWKTTRDVWVTEVKADKEIGDIDAIKKVVGPIFDNAALSDPGVRQALAVTGGGDHPAIIRTFYRMAKALSEGRPVQAGGVPDARPQRSAAQILYPNQRE
jgi:hypothetical protein